MAYLLRFSQKVGPLFASADTVNPSFPSVYCSIPPFPASSHNPFKHLHLQLFLDSDRNHVVICYLIWRHQFGHSPLHPRHCAARAFSFTSFTSFASLTSSKSFTIRTSMTPLPQLLYNPHLQAPLGSAGNKGLITPLESALTRNSPVTPVESALTKTGGGSFQAFIPVHPSSRVPAIRPGQCKSSVFEGWEGLQNFGGSGALEHRIILANSPVAEDQHALRILRDVVFVRHQHNGHSFVVLSAPERYASSSPIAIHLPAPTLPGSRATPSGMI